MKSKKSTVRGLICFLLFAVMLFDVVFLTKSVFGVLAQKRDNPIYFADSLKADFDPEKSEAVLIECKKLTETALTYTSMKKDITLFENYPYIQSEIERIRAANARERADTLYFAGQQVESGTVDEDMTENGFIVLSQNADTGTLVQFKGKPYFAAVDEEKINEYYDEQLAVRTEECKLNLSTAYRDAKQYLDKLENVIYFVSVNGETVTNGKLTRQDISGKLSQGGKCIYIKMNQGRISSAKTTGEITDGQKNAVASAAESFGKDAEVFFEFTGSMLFHESLKNTEKLYRECRAIVLKNIIAAVVCAAFAAVYIIIIAVLFPVKKSRKAVSGILGVLFAALILLSVYLLPNSVKLFLDPTMGTTWITVDSGSIFAKACLRACLGAGGITGLSVCIKSLLKK